MTTRRPVFPIVAASIAGPKPDELALAMVIGGSIECRDNRVFRTTAVQGPGGMIIRETDVTNTFNFKTAPPRPNSPAQRRSTK